MIDAPLAKDREGVPHQRLANALAAHFWMNGEILDEGRGPAQRRCRQPPLGVDDQEAQRRIEFGITRYARPPFVERPSVPSSNTAVKSACRAGASPGSKQRMTKPSGQCGATSVSSSILRNRMSFRAGGRGSGIALRRRAADGGACGRFQGRSPRAVPCAWHRNSSPSGRASRPSWRCRRPPTRRHADI